MQPPAYLWPVFTTSCFPVTETGILKHKQRRSGGRGGGGEQEDRSPGPATAAVVASAAHLSYVPSSRDPPIGRRATRPHLSLPLPLRHLMRPCRPSPHPPLHLKRETVRLGCRCRWSKCQKEQDFLVNCWAFAGFLLSFCLLDSVSQQLLWSLFSLCLRLRPSLRLLLMPSVVFLWFLWSQQLLFPSKVQFFQRALPFLCVLSYAAFALLLCSFSLSLFPSLIFLLVFEFETRKRKDRRT